MGAGDDARRQRRRLRAVDRRHLQGSLTSLDNDISTVDFVRMGALSVKTGATGTLYFDEFESRRGSTIGP